MSSGHLSPFGTRRTCCCLGDYLEAGKERTALKLSLGHVNCFKANGAARTVLCKLSQVSLYNGPDPWVSAHCACVPHQDDGFPSPRYLNRTRYDRFGYNIVSTAMVQFWSIQTVSH